MLHGALEDNLLTLLVWSEQHASALSIQVSPDLFSSRPYRKIASVAIEHLSNYSKPPGIHLRDILERDLERGEDGKLLERIIDDMDALRADLQPAYVLDALARWISLRKLAMAVEEASDAIQGGDLEAAERAIYQRDVAQASSPGIWAHDAEAMLGFLNQPEGDYFPSGIEELDKRGVRPFRKQLFLIIGAAKIGKSWWMIQLGKEAIFHRKSVLHISLENSEDLTAKRYIQAFYAMTSGKSETIKTPVFKKDQLGRFSALDFRQRTPDTVNLDNKGSIAKKLEGLSSKPKLLIKEFPTGSLTLAQLNAYLDALDRQQRFRPDLILVDSVNKMAMKGEKLRFDLSANAIGLRGISVARNCAIVTTTHSNRAGAVAKTVSANSHIGEDYGLLGTADTYCTISRTPQEKGHGLARIVVSGARDADDQFQLMISQSYATGQFCLDAVYMSKYIDQTMNKLNGEEEDD